MTNREKLATMLDGVTLAERAMKIRSGRSGHKLREETTDKVEVDKLALVLLSRCERCGQGIRARITTGKKDKKVVPRVEIFGPAAAIEECVPKVSEKRAAKKAAEKDTEELILVGGE